MALFAYCNEQFQEFIHIINVGDSTVRDKFRNLSVNTHLWDETDSQHKPKRPRFLTGNQQEQLVNDLKTFPEVEIIRILLQTGLLRNELEKRQVVTLLAYALYSKLTVDAFSLLLEHEDFKINFEDLFKEVWYPVYTRRLEDNKADYMIWLEKMQCLFECPIARLGQKAFLYLVHQCVHMLSCVVNDQDDLVKFFIKSIEMCISHAEFERNNMVNEIENMNALEKCIDLRNKEIRVRILKILFSQKNILMENKETGKHILLQLISYPFDDRNIESNYQEDLDLLLKHVDWNNNICDKRDGKSILIIAVEKQFPLTVEKLLKQPQLDVNMKDGRGWTALHYCAYTNSVEMWELLTTHPELDYNSKDEDGESPLFKVHLGYNSNPKSTDIVSWEQLSADIRSKHADSLLFKMVNNNKVDNNSRNKENQTFLLRESLSSFGCFDGICLILSCNDTDINIQDNQGQTALIMLMHASTISDTFAHLLEWHVCIVKALLKHPRINLDIQDQEGRTAFMHCIYEYNPVYKDIYIRQYKKFELLIGHELFDINIQDTNGETVFIKAIKNGTFKVFSSDSIFSLLLKQQNLDVNIEDNKGNTALHYLLHFQDGPKRRQALQMLAIDTRLCDLNRRDDQDNTPMHLFIQAKNLGTVRTILQNKCRSNEKPIDFSIVNKANRDVWDILLRCLQVFFDGDDTHDGSDIAEEVLSLAIELQCKDDINHLYRNGKSVLHKITEQGFSKAWRELIKISTIDVNLRDQSGNTSMMYAAKYLSPEDIKLFLEFKPDIDYEVKNKNDQTVIDIANETGNADLIKCLQIAFSVAKEKLRLEKDEVMNIEMKMKDIGAAIQTSDIASEKKKMLLLLAGQMQDILSGTHDARTHGMTEEHKMKIRINYVTLCKELMLEEVYPHLIQNDVMNENCVDEIQAEKTNLMKNKKFLERLQCSGPKAFETLINALKDTQPHLAELLENSQQEEQESSKQPGASGGVAF